MCLVEQPPRQLPNYPVFQLPAYSQHATRQVRYFAQRTSYHVCTPNAEITTTIISKREAQSIGLKSSTYSQPYAESERTIVDDCNNEVNFRLMSPQMVFATINIGYQVREARRRDPNIDQTVDLPSRSRGARMRALLLRFRYVRVAQRS